jgi:hypothetical protein
MVIVVVVVVVVGGCGGGSGCNNNFKTLSDYAGLLRYRNPLIEYGWIHNNSPIIWLKIIKLKGLRISSIRP